MAMSPGSAARHRPDCQDHDQSLCRVPPSGASLPKRTVEGACTAAAAVAAPSAAPRCKLAAPAERVVVPEMSLAASSARWRPGAPPRRRRSRPPTPAPGCRPRTSDPTAPRLPRRPSSTPRAGPSPTGRASASQMKTWASESPAEPSTNRASSWSLSSAAAQTPSSASSARRCAATSPEAGSKRARPALRGQVAHWTRRPGAACASATRARATTCTERAARRSGGGPGPRGSRSRRKVSRPPPPR
mmetsp:Transcript_39440/g.111838  ORF Transcript_39440/g.111838 Transcript_39440/m.111838 type:complete len:245 (+) Transcript_39440:571-1305(+)